MTNITLTIALASAVLVVCIMYIAVMFIIKYISTKKAMKGPQINNVIKIANPNVTSVSNLQDKSGSRTSAQRNKNAIQHGPQSFEVKSDSEDIQNEPKQICINMNQPTKGNDQCSYRISKKDRENRENALRHIASDKILLENEPKIASINTFVVASESKSISESESESDDKDTTRSRAISQDSRSESEVILTVSVNKRNNGNDCNKKT